MNRCRLFSIGLIAAAGVCVESIAMHPTYLYSRNGEHVISLRNREQLFQKFNADWRDMINRPQVHTKFTVIKETSWLRKWLWQEDDICACWYVKWDQEKEWISRTDAKEDCEEILQQLIDSTTDSQWRKRTQYGSMKLLEEGL